MNLKTTKDISDFISGFLLTAVEPYDNDVRCFTAEITPNDIRVRIDVAVDKEIKTTYFNYDKTECFELLNDAMKTQKAAPDENCPVCGK